MFEYQITMGLNDKKTKVQKMKTKEAHEKITKILLNHFKIYAFTMFDCLGCYKHENGEIVRESSIRIEIATEKNIDEKINLLIKTLKHKRIFHQESIMLKKNNSNIYFK